MRFAMGTSELSYVQIFFTTLKCTSACCMPVPFAIYRDDHDRLRRIIGAKPRSPGESSSAALI